MFSFCDFVGDVPLGPVTLGKLPVIVRVASRKVRAGLLAITEECAVRCCVEELLCGRTEKTCFLPLLSLVLVVWDETAPAESTLSFRKPRRANGQIWCKQWFVQWNE